MKLYDTFFWPVQYYLLSLMPQQISVYNLITQSYIMVIYLNLWR